MAEDSYKELATYKYFSDPALWQSKEQNSANFKYDSGIEGALNVTSVFGANAVVTRGRYYGLDENVKKPVIVSSTGSD